MSLSKLIENQFDCMNDDTQAFQQLICIESFLCVLLAEDMFHQFSTNIQEYYVYIGHAIKNNFILH